MSSINLGGITDGYSDASGKKKKRRRALGFLTAGAAAPALAGKKLKERKKKRSKNGTKVRIGRLIREYDQRKDKSQTFRQWMKGNKLGTKAVMSRAEHQRIIMPLLDTKPTDAKHKAIVAAAVDFITNKEIPAEPKKKSSADGQDNLNMEQGNDDMDEFEFAEGKSKDGGEGAKEAVEYEDEDYEGGSGSMPMWKKAGIVGGIGAAIWYFFIRKK
jgi:hypothetical protein